MVNSLTAVCVGILTLGIEILAGRVLAPFFGSSLHQWAALIGVALVAYGLGYAIYHRITRWGLSIPLIMGGAYVLSLPLWVHQALGSFLGWRLEIASVFGAFIAVGVPSLFWASVLPYLQALSARSSNRGSASMLAWSAAGNLIGAWGVAFFGVPVLGTRVTLLSLGIFSLLLALLWSKEHKRKGIISLLVLITLGVGFPALKWAWARTQDASDRPWVVSESEAGGKDISRTLVLSRDTPYQHIAIWDESEWNLKKRVFSMNGNLQFLWNSKEKLTSGVRYEYYNFSTAAPMWVEGQKSRSALILGLGGGLIPWQLHQFFPDLKITCFELDPEVAKVARESLPLAKAGEVEVRLGDGRTLLRHDTAKYDYILLDTFLNSYVPFHLTTREFFQLAKDHLNPQGILVANFHTIFARSGLLPKLEATIRSVFPQAGVVTLPAGTTLVVALPETPPATSSLEDRLRMASDTGPDELRGLSQRALIALRAATVPSDEASDNVLTDDRNDTEQRLYETRRHIVISRNL